VQLPGATAVFRRLKLDFCCRERQGPEPARPARRAGCPAAPQHPARRH
jgi:iron-sulfur cluster repair protein YtfE (RIC family)